MIRDNKNLPDVSTSRMRNDFEKIFNMHQVVDAKRIRLNDSYTGDFFENTTPTETTTNITISIQGTADSIKRLKQGIEAPKGSIHAYARYDLDLKTTDKIQIGDLYFQVQNIQDNIKNGDSIFQSFDLLYIERVG